LFIFLGSPDLKLFSFGVKVDVLRTKTRPKKIVAISQDGSHRLLLVKHGEDLRLDERLMQVFKLTKQWSYSVVPIGPFVGVIHIVEGNLCII
jgi:phosphatidylinositol kinase/protein kinase (PI-3  family)